jgi:hypothetical protein
VKLIFVLPIFVLLIFVLLIYLDDGAAIRRYGAEMRRWRT